MNAKLRITLGWISLLIMCFPPAHAQQAGGATLPPLRQAIESGDAETVNAHLQNGAKEVVNIKWHNNWMPLHVAVSHNQAEITKLLLENGAPVNEQPAGDFYGTPLHLAAGEGSLEIIQILIDAGANVNIKNGYEELPLNKAEEGGYGDIVELLIEAGTNVPADFDSGITPLHNAVAHNNSEEVRRLLATGVDINARTRKSLTPLFLAVGHADTESAQMLLDAGADVTIKDMDGKTVLHEAAFSGNLQIVQLLVNNKKMDVNEKAQYDQSPLSYTVIGDFVEVAEFLIQNGANIRERNKVTKESLLHQAALMDARKITQLLLENDVDVNATDFIGQTPLDMATDMNHHQIATILKRHGGRNASWLDKAKSFIGMMYWLLEPQN